MTRCQVSEGSGDQQVGRSWVWVGDRAEGDVGFVEPPVCQILRKASEKRLTRSSQQPDDMGTIYGRN